MGQDDSYPAYGIMRAGAHAEITGKFTPWWAVRLPNHPDEIGWIPQQLVSTTNSENVPSLPAPAPDFGRTYPLPDFDEPQILVTDPTLILAGPGQQYPAVLGGLAGANLYVLGKSEDELFWMVYLPPEIVSAGNGWISTASVMPLNTECGPPGQSPPGAVRGPVPGSQFPRRCRSHHYQHPFRAQPDYDVLDFLLKGQILPVLGRTQEGDWLEVQVPASVSESLKAWVAEPNVYIYNADKVQIVPTPLPAWIPTSVTATTCSVVYQSPTNGKTFYANQDFSLVIDLVNHTNKTWSTGNVDITFVSGLNGEILHTGPDAYDLDYSVLSGQTYRLTIPATSTFGSGDLGEVWAVNEGSQVLCSFTYRIYIGATPLPPTSTPWPTQTGTIEPTPPPDVPPTPTVGTKEPTPPPEVSPTPRW